MNDLPAGLYDLLHTKELHKRLEKKGLLDQAVWKSIGNEDFVRYFTKPIASEIAIFVSEMISNQKNESLIQNLEKV